MPSGGLYATDPTFYGNGGYMLPIPPFTGIRNNHWQSKPSNLGTIKLDDWIFICARWDNPCNQPLICWGKEDWITTHTPTDTMLDGINKQVCKTLGKSSILFLKTIIKHHANDVFKIAQRIRTIVRVAVKRSWQVQLCKTARKHEPFVQSAHVLSRFILCILHNRINLNIIYIRNNYPSHNILYIDDSINNIHITYWFVLCHPRPQSPPKTARTAGLRVLVHACCSFLPSLSWSMVPWCHWVEWCSLDFCWSWWSTRGTWSSVLKRKLFEQTLIDTDFEIKVQIWMMYMLIHGHVTSHRGILCRGCFMMFLQSTRFNIHMEHGTLEHHVPEFPCVPIRNIFFSNSHSTGQIITTSAEVTPNGGLVGESPQNDLNSGLGIIVICPDSRKNAKENNPTLSVFPKALLTLCMLSGGLVMGNLLLGRYWYYVNKKQSHSNRCWRWKMMQTWAELPWILGMCFLCWDVLWRTGFEILQNVKMLRSQQRQGVRRVMDLRFFIPKKCQAWTDQLQIANQWWWWWRRGTWRWIPPPVIMIQ